MNRSCLSLIVGVSLIFLAHSASAQSPAEKAKAPGNNLAIRDKSDPKVEADRIAKERRAQARSLLISLASDARSFRDMTLRARSLARIADTLWDADAEQGRTLFRRAWEAAETADENPAPYTLGQEAPDLRGEVLRLAVRRDRLLAEEFLQKLKADQEETKTSHAESGSWSLPEADEQRLRLARDLLGKGEIERSLQFADPILGSATISTVDFISQLRDKDPSAADQRYAALLANTGRDMLANANAISLLSSYIFTPHMYVIFGSDGSASSSWMPTTYPQATVSPQLRLAFFQTAADILLRPQPPPEQEQSTAVIVVKYMVVMRLMPLFDQYAPREIVAAMRAQFEALTSLVHDDLRQGENEWVQKGIGPEKPLADQEQSLLDQIDHAGTSDERDELYFKLALLALSQDDLKARDYVSKIDASSFRKGAQAWVDACLAISAIKKKKLQRALELARSGELTHIQRLWVLTQAAKLLSKTDRDKALSLLGDATVEARRIGGDDLDRPRGWLAIANALKLIEPLRAWDAILDAINAANSTASFTGEGGGLPLNVSSKGQIFNRMDGVPDFDIEGIFGKLANDDYNRAVQMARHFHLLRGSTS